VPDTCGERPDGHVARSLDIRVDLRTLIGLARESEPSITENENPTSCQHGCIRVQHLSTREREVRCAVIPGAERAERWVPLALPPDGYAVVDDCGISPIERRGAFGNRYLRRPVREKRVDQNPNALDKIKACLLCWRNRLRYRRPSA